MIYFTSDFHLYHENIVNLNPKIRFKGFELVILSNLSSLLKPKDTLFVVGDFTWHFNDEKGYLKLWKSLPFRKVLILGNHDQKPEKLREYFEEVYDFYHTIEVEGIRILLSHYPAKDPITERYPERQQLVREIYFKEGCNLLVHGHVHWNEEGIRCGCRDLGIKCVNVNVEWWNYEPVSLEQVLACGEAL